MGRQYSACSCVGPSRKHFGVPLFTGVRGAANGLTGFDDIKDPLDAYLTSQLSLNYAGLLLLDFEGQMLHERYWGGNDRFFDVAGFRSRCSFRALGGRAACWFHLVGRAAVDTLMA